MTLQPGDRVTLHFPQCEPAIGTVEAIKNAAGDDPTVVFRHDGLMPGAPGFWALASQCEAVDEQP